MVILLEKENLYYKNGNIKYEGGFDYKDYLVFFYEGKGKLFDEKGNITHEGGFKNGKYE